ncbi:hypothetical protein [Sphingomonas sp.]|uniref:hypothetical protein n=1 Tax=Sphingomonas sp. TaxID=28214 RepID=UPI0025CD32E6|nr:hypothetical protein [Sphingomonas sp.]MBV9529349.1 hypothetical protein [Sphingomonas sp.]
MGRSLRPGDGVSYGIGISLYQAAAAALPGRATGELVELDERSPAAADQPRSLGSFEDFERLVEQLATVPAAVGKPPFRDRRRSRRRVGSCPEAHNRALLGDYAP